MHLIVAAQPSIGHGAPHACLYNSYVALRRCLGFAYKCDEGRASEAMEGPALQANHEGVTWMAMPHLRKPTGFHGGVNGCRHPGESPVQGWLQCRKGGRGGQGCTTCPGASTCPWTPTDCCTGPADPTPCSRPSAGQGAG